MHQTLICPNPSFKQPGFFFPDIINLRPELSFKWEGSHFDAWSPNEPLPLFTPSHKRLWLQLIRAMVAKYQPLFLIPKPFSLHLSPQPENEMLLLSGPRIISRKKLHLQIQAFKGAGHEHLNSKRLHLFSFKVFCKPLAKSESQSYFWHRLCH